jgi:hypothetical protein
VASAGFLFWVVNQETLPQLVTPDDSAVKVYVSPPQAIAQMLVRVAPDPHCMSGAHLSLSISLVRMEPDRSGGGFAVVLTGGAQITRENPSFDKSDNLVAGTVSIVQPGTAGSPVDGELFWGVLLSSGNFTSLSGCMAAPVKATAGVLTTVDLPTFGDPEIADEVGLGIPAPPVTVGADDHQASRVALDGYNVPRILQVRVAIADPAISGPQISFDRVSPQPVAGPNSTTWTSTSSVVTVGLVARNVSADRVYQLLLVIAGILIGTGVSLFVKAAVG